MHNSKTVWHIQMTCTPNNYFTIRDVPILGYSCMQGSKHTSQSLSNEPFCVYVHAQLQVTYGHSMYRTTTLLSAMSIFYVRVMCNIWLASYGSKHIAVPFRCNISCILTNSKTTGCTWPFYISKQLHYYWRCLFSGLELHAGYNWHT